ncbi:MAG: SusC/RagA family TonB-linked outer membrane protein, partial [Tannerella sp.]|nr:SusC/RagA family TonB-linked outer membrane protein [Tannerella sp.]
MMKIKFVVVKRNTWRKIACAMLCIFFGSLVAFAQRQVTGTVKDSGGEALIGANVIEKGKANGVITDADGNFSLKVSENAVLQVSYIGYVTQEIRNFSTDRPVHVILSENVQMLDEVVAIGYGSQSKMKLTGSSSFLKSEELGKMQSTNFAQQIIGKMSGIIINETSGQPHQSPQIIIRGIGTLTAGIAPLIVIDGFPLSEGTALNAINPNDIESVNVLKDAAAASIYGSRGANGVILVTTKKGQSGSRSKVEFNYYTGFQQQSSKLELANAAETAQFLTEARDWGYVSRDPDNRNENDDEATRIAKGANLRQRRLHYLTNPGLSGLADTNWLDEVFRTAPVSSYSASISGGTDRTSYLISANYLDQQGTIIETDYKRYSSSFSLETKLGNKFKFDVSLNPSYSIYNTYNEGGGNNQNPLAISLIMYPFFSPYNDDGTLAIGTQLTANAPEDGALAENPVAIMKTNIYKRNNFRIFGRGALTFDITKNLQFKSMLGGDYRGENQTFYTPSYVGQYRTTAPKPASTIEYSFFRNNFITENTLSF